MVRRRRHGRAVVLALGTLFVLAGCSSPASHIMTVRSTAASPNAATSAAATCGTGQIRDAVASFFTAWDRRDEHALESLFGADGELDMATKYEDTLHDQQWTASAGSSAIAGFAALQWHLGETLTYHGMDIYPPQYGGGGGAEVDEVSATFSDRSVQLIEEAKFNYDCSQHALTHVVITSAGVARKP